MFGLAQQRIKFKSSNFIFKMLWRRKQHMICLGKYSFMVLFLSENIFLGFLKEHMVFVWEICLVLFFIVEFFFLLIWQTIASLPLKWCRQLKNDNKRKLWSVFGRKSGCRKGMNLVKLSSPNDFLNFLQIDEGTYEELLNWLAPKIQKCDVISPNQRLSIIRDYVFLLQAIPFLKLVFHNTTCGEINKV